jgi:hypothetical protein
MVGNFNEEVTMKKKLMFLNSENSEKENFYIPNSMIGHHEEGPESHYLVIPP